MLLPRTSSKAKVDRGASPRVYKEYWLKTREVINIGTGICKQCATRHRKYFISSPLKVSSEADIELFERILNFNSTEDEHSQHTVEDNHMEIEDLNSQFSNFTQTTIDQSSQQTSSDWEKTMKLIKIVASEAVNLVLSHIVPGQVYTVFSEIVKRQDSYDENPTLDKQDILTRALVKAYLDQDNRQTQTQILSLFADKFSKENLLKLIPVVTLSKIDTARRHAF
ncbi:unnamed protein product [Mytilus edulis]|uniref:Uncharacterized protein n=1 Tax=Mytilus edulis TaxID=6550 RepID=A0A8S3V9N5_MYTED|nr:unnamed protein product [Mytilus edulis]